MAVTSCMLPFFDGPEMSALQHLNKFFYDSAVSRVQSKVPLGKVLHFISANNNGHSLIKYESRSKTVTKVGNSANLNDWISK